MNSPDKTQKIRFLNDKLRSKQEDGQIVVTSGIEALGVETYVDIANAIRKFDDFNSDNDPYGEHDCAVMTIDGLKIIWKIDYYDHSLRMASPDASDPSVTSRVMTIMLAEEY